MFPYLYFWSNDRNFSHKPKNEPHIAWELFPTESCHIALRHYTKSGSEYLEEEGYGRGWEEGPEERVARSISGF